MNKARRKAIETLMNELNDKLNETASLKVFLEDVGSRLQDFRDEEEEYKDCMPASIQNGEKGEAADQVIERLDEAGNEVETAGSAVDDLETALSAMIEALESAKV